MKIFILHIKSIFTFLFLTSVFFLTSCEGDYDIRYRFTGLDAVHAQNTGVLPEVTNWDSIPKEAYVLRLNLFSEETSRRGRYLDTETPPMNENPIDSISITSDSNFNDTLPSGSILNSVFLIFNGNYLNTSLVDQHFITNVYSANFYEEPIPKYADLLLMIPPDSVQTFKFYIYMRLLDGTVYKDSTTAIKLY